MKVSITSMVRLRHLAGFSCGRWAALKAARGRPLDHPGVVHLLASQNADAGGLKLLYSGDVYANESPN
jgi:hypothetical protein